MKISRICKEKKRMTLIVPGNPVPWQRAGKNNRTGAIYTQKETRNQEEFIRYLYLGKYGYDCFFEPDEPVKILVKSYRPVPKTTPKKYISKMVDGTLLPIVKPDTDNYEKLVMDALNKIAYHDDSQIVSATSDKYYSLNPRTEIYMETIVKEPETVVTVEK